MAKAGKKPSTNAPGCVQFAGAILGGKGGTHADSGRSATVLLDGPPPQSAARWLDDAVARMKAAPDCPEKITYAARRLEKEMAEAFSRRQCDQLWVWGVIKTNLLTWGLWSRTRPIKR